MVSHPRTPSILLGFLHILCSWRWVLSLNLSTLSSQGQKAGYCLRCLRTSHWPCALILPRFFGDGKILWKPQDLRPAATLPRPLRMSPANLQSVSSGPRNSILLPILLRLLLWHPAQRLQPSHGTPRLPSTSGLSGTRFTSMCSGARGIFGNPAFVVGSRPCKEFLFHRTGC